MEILKIYKTIIGLLFLILPVLATSCSDENVDAPHNASPEDEDLVCLPLGINLGPDFPHTRVSEGYEYGSEEEHKVALNGENECYAIFFDKAGKAKYVKPLFFENELNTHDTPSEGSEYTLYAVVYVPKNDVMNSYESTSVIDGVLVVLNGGNIYKQISDKVRDLADPSYRGSDAVKQVLDLTWTWASYAPTGRNKDGLFTMTNSSYLDDAGKPQTVAKLNLNNTYASITEYLKGGKQNSATIYLERMVAKFYAPVFNTEIISEDNPHMFRPSDENAKLVIYRWEGEERKITELDWRIHVLNWTINGLETMNYIFKKIPTNIDGTDLNYERISKNWPKWNSPEEHRSYWSIDPHYDTREGFYPWQYRKAADREDVISWMAATSKGEEYNPVLRYSALKDLGDHWNDYLYFCENTFNPEGDWYDITKPTYLDDRASLLAGPHLLLTAEVYIEGQGDKDYRGIYGKPAHLYSDRVSRYYLTEIDWFKSFVKEFTRSMSTQVSLSFPVYDWDDPDKKIVGVKYRALVPGNCYVYYGNTKLDSNAAVDAALGGKSISFNGNVRQGDGRVIPWIEGLNIRDKDGKELVFELESGTPTVEISKEDLYRSLFYDWFGPVDHFNKGQMYYAGSIRHQRVQEGTQWHDYYGAVRNHAYKFTVAALNGLGSPVDDADQLIIPDKYAYNDQLGVYVELLPTHLKDTNVTLGD